MHFKSSKYEAIFIESALNVWPNQRTLNIFFQCALKLERACKETIKYKN